MVIIHRDDRQEFGVVFVGSVSGAAHNSTQKDLGTKPYNFPESTVGFDENVEAAET
jgi:hypothetical protein